MIAALAYGELMHIDRLDHLLLTVAAESVNLSEALVAGVY
jgi:hypothetical protein